MNHQVAWQVRHGNILDQPADVLVCSANVLLNLSGGVGGEILRRCGLPAQEELHGYLHRQARKYVAQGEVVQTLPHGLPFKAILHAVAIDGFYQTTPAIVRDVTDKCLHASAAIGARSVSLTALATGYGRLPMRKFADAIAPLLTREYGSVTEVGICVKSRDEATDLAEALGLT